MQASLREEFTSHFVRENRDGSSKVLCPLLLQNKCHRCGEMGHTPRYCPGAIVVPKSSQEGKAIRSLCPKTRNTHCTYEIVLQEDAKSLSGGTKVLAKTKKSYAEVAAESSAAPKRKVVKRSSRLVARGGKQRVSYADVTTVPPKITIIPKRVTFAIPVEVPTTTMPDVDSVGVPKPTFVCGVNEDGDELWGDLALEEELWNEYEAQIAHQKS